MKLHKQKYIFFIYPVSIQRKSLLVQLVRRTEVCIDEDEKVI